MFEREEFLINNIEKGKVGEGKVVEAIYKASKMADVKLKLFNNLILEFPSMFGEDGTMTTEIDHIAIVGKYIFIIETKMDKYMPYDYSENRWTLFNGTTTSNPIIQNRLHKNVFSSVFGIDRSVIFTVECLLNYQNCRIKTQYPNDYVLGNDNLIDGLALLFKTDTTDFDYNDLFERLTLLERESGLNRKKHENFLATANKFWKWARSHEGHYNFKETDVALCTCGGMLVIKGGKWPDYKRGNKRASWQQMIGCTNYKKDGTGCNVKFYYDTQLGRGFDKVVTTSIEERMGWEEMEASQTTLLDRYLNQEQIIKEKQEQMNLLKRRVEEQQRVIEKLKEENSVQKSRVDKVMSEQNCMKKELEKYLHLIGPLYRKIK